MLASYTETPAVGKAAAQVMGTLKVYRSWVLSGAKNSLIIKSQPSPTSESFQVVHVQLYIQTCVCTYLPRCKIQGERCAPR